jgi:hypothetical protein
MSVQQPPQKITILYNDQPVRVQVNRNNPDEQFIVFLPQEKVILNVRNDGEGMRSGMSRVWRTPSGLMRSAN